MLAVPSATIEATFSRFLFRRELVMLAILGPAIEGSCRSRVQ